MNSISNYDKYRIFYSSYASLYRSILIEKKYNDEDINLFLIFLLFLIEKHYYEYDYIIDPKCSFFDSIEWFLREKM